MIIGLFTSNSLIKWNSYNNPICWVYLVKNTLVIGVCAIWWIYLVNKAHVTGSGTCALLWIPRASRGWCYSCRAMAWLALSEVKQRCLGSPSGWVTSTRITTSMVDRVKAVTLGEDCGWFSINLQPLSTQAVNWVPGYKSICKNCILGVMSSESVGPSPGGEHNLSTA